MNRYLDPLLNGIDELLPGADSAIDGSDRVEVFDAHPAPGTVAAGLFLPGSIVAILARAGSPAFADTREALRRGDPAALDTSLRNLHVEMHSPGPSYPTTLVEPVRAALVYAGKVLRGSISIPGECGVAMMAFRYTGGARFPAGRLRLAAPGGRAGLDALIVKHEPRATAAATSALPPTRITLDLNATDAPAGSGATSAPSPARPGAAKKVVPGASSV